MTILNCENIKCKFRTTGNCRLENITLISDGRSVANSIMCIQAEPRDENCDGADVPGSGAKPIDQETVWGTGKDERKEDDIC